MESTMCKRCGTVIMPDELFCPQCGLPVKMLPPDESGEIPGKNLESSDRKNTDSQQLLNSYLQEAGIPGAGYDDFWGKPDPTFKKDGIPASGDSSKQKTSVWGEALSQGGESAEQATITRETETVDTDAAWRTEAPVYKNSEHIPEHIEEANAQKGVSVQKKASTADVTINQDAWNEWMKNNILQQQKVGNHSEGTRSLISGLFGRKKKNS